MRNINFLPLFDSIHHITKNEMHAILPSPIYLDDFRHALQFLKSYTGCLGTFNSYRLETERLLQWCWLVKKSTLSKLKREDIEKYIRFCQNPAKSWIGIKRVPRYIEKEGKRQPNNLWKPFVATVSKAENKQGIKPSINNFSLSQGAIRRVFAALSTLFNFLVAEEYLNSNPVTLIRQKSKFIRKTQHPDPVRRLSALQWKTVLQVARHLAEKNPKKHERTLFILSLLYGLYLRISELAANERWIPTMNDFAKDNNDCWWFTTVGKGNKERQIAVSDAMLESLIRWRSFLGLTPLPSLADDTPLIPTINGHGPISDSASIRRLVQEVFDIAAGQLRRKGFIEEADVLDTATVHWLRHTGISEDVKIRPREHVRDDAGHSSSTTTERYIDVEKIERHRSARHKTIRIIY